MHKKLHLTYCTHIFFIIFKMACLLIMVLRKSLFQCWGIREPEQEIQLFGEAFPYLLLTHSLSVSFVFFTFGKIISQIKVNGIAKFLKNPEIKILKRTNTSIIIKIIFLNTLTYFTGIKNICIFCCCCCYYCIIRRLSIICRLLLFTLLLSGTEIPSLIFPVL